MGSQINVIEDKRKFDIMEFVSQCGGGGGEEPADGWRDQGKRGVCPLPTLSPGAAFGGGPGYPLPAGPRGAEPAGPVSQGAGWPGRAPASREVEEGGKGL